MYIYIYIHALRSWCGVHHTATHCNTLQLAALQHTNPHLSSANNTATHCNTLQHAAARCSTLQLAATRCNSAANNMPTHCIALRHTATHCNTLQHTATRCNTLQLAATRCNSLHHTTTHRSTKISRQQHAPAFGRSCCRKLKRQEFLASQLAAKFCYVQCHCVYENVSEVGLVLDFSFQNTLRLTCEKFYHRRELGDAR